MLNLEGADLSTLMTTAQVARAHGYTREGVIAAVRVGRLRSVGKLPARNGALLFNPADVAAWQSSLRGSGGRTIYGAGA